MIKNIKFKNLLLASSLAIVLVGCEKPKQSWNETNNGKSYVCTDNKGVRVPEVNCERNYNSNGNANSNAFVWFMLGQSMGSNNNNYYPQYGASIDRNRGTYAPTYTQSYFSSRSAAMQKSYSPAFKAEASRAAIARAQSTSVSSVSKGGFGSTASAHSSSAGG